ncbi:MAG: glycosyltransferase family 4 protein [Acidimicrobiia bacterium]
MRVCVVTPYAVDVPGGVQGQAVRLVEWLREAGHDAWLVGPGRGGPDGTRHVGGALSLPANRSVAPINFSPAAAKRVAGAAAGADLVHLHEPFVPAVSLGALLSRTPPKVGTFHADPGPVIRSLYRGGAPVLRRWAARLRAATAVSPVAQAAVSGFVEATVVPNGLDVEAFRLDVERHPLRVVFVGRDEARKGLDVLLDAWPSVRSRLPEAELVVVGARRDRRPPGVRFLGWLDEAAKRNQVAASAVLCAPNLGGESFGLVLAEGMAAGCAVVASGLSGFASVVGEAGVLVPPGDVEGLAAALVAILADPTRRDRLARAGAERVQTLDRERVLGGYLSVYETALAGP